MSDRTIDEATPDTQVTGVENIPVSDGGSPKCVTVTQVKDFVLNKIGTIANVSTPAIATDGVYIKRNSELKPISAQDLANAIISFAFSKEEVPTLTTEAVIVIKSGDDIKTTDVNELAEVIKDAIELNAFDIASLSAATSITREGYIALTQLSQSTSGTHVTRKCKIADAATAFVSGIYDTLQESTAISDDAYFMVWPTGGAYPRSVKRRNLGLGSGDVIGPSTNTDGKIPQWDGTDSKTLKDGLSVTGSITSSSSSTEIPTAAAVYSAVSNISVSGDVTGPASSVNGQMALFNGDTGKVIKTGGLVSNSIGTTASTSNVTTENAVRTEAAAQITASLATGGSVKSAIDTAVSDKAIAPNSPTAGKIPQWNGGGTKILTEGLTLTTSISSSIPSNYNVPTENAVVDYIDNAISPSLENVVKDEGAQTSDIVNIVGHWTTPYGSGVVNHYGHFAFPTNIVKVSDESVTDGAVPVFDGTTGKLVRQGYRISSTTEPVPISDADGMLITAGRHDQLYNNRAHFMGTFSSNELPSTAPEGSWAFDTTQATQMYFRRGTSWYKVEMTALS